MVKPRFDGLSGCHIKPIRSVNHAANLALITAGRLDSFRKNGKRPVLFLHGSMSPTLLTGAYRIGGLSWFDFLSMDTRSVWGLDFLGYGESDPYPAAWQQEMGHDPNDYGGASSQMAEIDNAVTRILASTGADSLHVVAISRGSIPAGYYAAANPEKVRSLIFHAPITRNDGKASALLVKYFGSVALPRISHFAMSAEQHFEFVRDDKPPGTISPLEPEFAASWTSDYSQRVHGDPYKADLPVLAPIGFAVDIHNAWNGIYFDESGITMPTLIFRGEWDQRLTPADGCQELFEGIASPVKRYLQLSQATHSMMYETCRHTIYRESAAFLREHD